MITILALIRRTIDRVVVIELVFLSCLLLSSVYSFVSCYPLKKAIFEMIQLEGKICQLPFWRRKNRRKTFQDFTFVSFFSEKLILLERE